MSISPTAHRIEGYSADEAAIIPVTQLRPGDLVFDADGVTHPLDTVALGSESSVWIHRSDLTYVEHLRGSILAVRRSSTGGPTR